MYIKPARKTPKYYITYFPDKIYCSPYKYDLLVQLSTDLSENNEIIFKYIDSETNEEIKHNHKNKPALEIGKTRITKKEDENLTEILYRVCFTVCSFHHYRRPFVLKVFLKDNETEEEKLFFKSKPFQTFARKSDLEDIEAWISDDESTTSTRKRSTKEENEKLQKRKRKKVFKIEEDIDGEQEEEEEEENDFEDPFEEKKQKRRKFKKQIRLTPSDESSTDPFTTLENLM